MIRRLRRFFHCLFGMFSGHQMFTAWDDDGNVTTIGCICGKDF